MTKRQQKIRIGFSILAIIIAFFVLGKTELSANSQLYSAIKKDSASGNNFQCSLETQAQKYLDDIYQFSPDHFKVSKPKLVFDASDNLYMGSDVVVGKADGKNITIYEKGFEDLYGETCSEASIERLQSTIAHEYAHHIDFNSGAIKKTIGTENLEYSAQLGGEHALFELVWNKENPKAAKMDTAKEQEEIGELKSKLKSI